MLEQIPWKSNKQNNSVTLEQLQLQPRNSQQNHSQAFLGALATCAKRETSGGLKCLEVVGFLKSTSMTSTKNLNFFL